MRDELCFAHEELERTLAVQPMFPPEQFILHLAVPPDELAPAGAIGYMGEKVLLSLCPAGQFIHHRFEILFLTHCNRFAVVYTSHAPQGISQCGAQFHTGQSPVFHIAKQYFTGRVHAPKGW